ncbi:MAG: secretion system protein [Friedmanniella sp.]|nr:secretion system protein [Friedmanniella sp.]
MPPVVAVAVVGLGLFVAVVVFSLVTRRDPERERLLANLERGLVSHVSAEPELGSNARTGLQALARRLTPPSSLPRLDRLLARAGRPAAWPLERVLTVKVVLPPVLLAVGLFYLSTSPGALTILIVLAVTVVSYFLPDLLLHSRGQERSQKIGLELADTLDQMTIAVEAGLGFDSAMARAGKNGKGPLAEELVRTLQDIQVGQSRRQAYEGLATRTQVPDLRKFVSAITQADKYGIAISEVLKTQAAEMRIKRRQGAEEKAMQIPVKVLFPLMLCILPVLFIVLLGPAAMDIVSAFS